jgi:hypothetical protein
MNDLYTAMVQAQIELEHAMSKMAQAITAYEVSLEQEAEDAYVQKALTAINEYICNNDVSEICDKLGITL